MKTVILAGGLGTRISEETTTKPKPMIEIGGMPILWHIMKIYSSFGLNEFVVCCGYKGYVIKEFVANYSLHMSDVTFDLAQNEMQFLDSRAERWKVTLIDTGTSTMTGGRLKRVHDYVKSDEAFCMTYGDGLANVDLTDLLRFHKSHGKLATLTGVSPPGRFGAIKLDGDRVNAFIEKPRGDGGMINGGFFVLSPKALDYVSGDQTIWEQEPLKGLAEDGELHAYEHKGFWHPMDTLRDKNYLESLWSREIAPWKSW